MSEDNSKAGEADLHLAATKPAMVPILNIPWVSTIVLGGITVELATLYWKLVFIAVPLWPVAIYIFREDHNGMRVLGAWIRTAGMDFHAHWFGGTSVETFPRTYRGRFRGIPNV